MIAGSQSVQHDMLIQRACHSIIAGTIFTLPTSYKNPVATHDRCNTPPNPNSKNAKLSLQLRGENGNNQSAIPRIISQANSAFF
jgi:hypothetical protein